MRLFRTRVALAAALLPLVSTAVHAEAPAADLPAVQVTATRTPEPVDRLPASVTIISGDELRARGADSLRSALAFVAGVDAPPGGDAGPASAVPSIWGLHEFDAFLLVVDGVPWGGAFNPSIPTLDLTNVERIEVLKGAAPVIYGATAFVGVIQVIHYPAGQATNNVQLGYGSYGSLRGSGAYALPSIGGYQQSISVSGERQQFSDPREGINNGRFLYRGAAPLAGGNLRIDADASLQRQAPSSPSIRQDQQLVTRVDANFNPADARIDEHRYHFVLGYSHDTFLGLWDTTASYAHSNVTDVRGFLRPDLQTDDVGTNSDYFNQDRGILDAYFDTHFSKRLARTLSLVYGADLLYGSGKQQSTNGAYFATIDGSQIPQGTADRPVDEINGIDDRRSFLGQYAQLDWKPGTRWNVLAGLRLNETHERKTSTHIDTADDTADTYAYDAKNKTKLSGTLGVSYQAWHLGRDEAVLYADYRNTFKPSAIDFGPDVTPTVLNPETARSYEGGVKGKVGGGLIEYDASIFFLHFNNLVVSTASGLQNAGSEIFRGFELETRFHIYNDLTTGLSYSYHDARFVKYIADDGGTPADFGGKRQPLSPHVLASYGFYYTPHQGLNASVIAAYVGNRYLDEGNTASTHSYTTIDATVGYHYRRYGISLNGYNLTNERKPVTASEFGDSSFYLLPARSLIANLSVDLK